MRQRIALALRPPGIRNIRQGGQQIGKRNMAPSHQGARHRFRLFAARVDSFSDQQTHADLHYDNQPLTQEN